MKIRLYILLACYIAIKLCISGVPAISGDFFTPSTAKRVAAITSPRNVQGASFTAVEQSFDEIQLIEEDDRDDEFLRTEKSTVVNKFIHYDYIPVFSIQNKHFLVHFISSIKDKLPGISILFSIFLI